MKKQIHSLLFRVLSIENYLKFLQYSYFILYKTGLLRFNPSYNLHYFVKGLVKKGDTVIDIGANLGYYSVLFSNWVGETGTVYCVEPIPIYNKLLKNIRSKFDNIIIYPYALGLEEKEIKMVNHLHEGFYRTGLPHVYEQKKDGDIDSIEYQFDVQMKKASGLFKNLKMINYIKCDVEGFEYNVLFDMEDIIKKFKPIVQVEVWEENDYKIRELFHNIGYKLYSLNYKKQLVEVSNENQPISGDYIFIYPSDF